MAQQSPARSPIISPSTSSFILNETYNGIHGAFILHDLLSITTSSGSIDITVLPKHAISSKAPAKLRLKTTSGSIRVRMAPSLHDPPEGTPDRVFESVIMSTSGSITATLIHNYKTDLATMSGNINVSLYPLIQPGSMSHVDVRCMSGSTSMVIHPYIKTPGASLITDFYGRSGRLKVHIPSTWEGEVTAHLHKGRVRYDWEGLQVLSDSRRFAAVKGNGQEKLNIHGQGLNVELTGECMLSLPREAEVKEGELVPGPAKEVKREVDMQGKGEPVADLPIEEEWQEVEEDDDDWTIVETRTVHRKS